MRKSFVALAVAAALAQPASAITFPTLTTIYVGSGVVDSGSPHEQGIATSINCSNVSGVEVQVRVLVLNLDGTAAGSLTVHLAHGATATFSTHETFVYFEDIGNLNTGAVLRGVVNVEARNSAVFCSAAVVDAAGLPPSFAIPIHLVRVNPHPGTVE
jgi:hypothetical protein